MTSIQDVHIAIDLMRKTSREKIVLKPSHEYVDPMQGLPKHLLFSIGDNGDYKTLADATCPFGGYCRSSCKLCIDNKCCIYQTSNSINPKSEKSLVEARLIEAEDEECVVEKKASQVSSPPPHPPALQLEVTD